jgi:hypothetical protein
MTVIEKRIKALEAVEIYVGIPEQNNSRDGESVTNAELAFIHEHGSPLKNIPARPFIRPAISLPRNQKMIRAQLAVAARAVLAGDESAANRELNKTGLLAANAVKRFLADFPANQLAPNAPSTIRRKGSSTPLIDSGELRRAVSYIVKSIENLPKDKWKKSEVDEKSTDKKFGQETDEPTPPKAEGFGKVAQGEVEGAETLVEGLVEGAETAVEGAAEGIAEAAEVLGEVAIL